MRRIQEGKKQAHRHGVCAASGNFTYDALHFRRGHCPDHLAIAIETLPHSEAQGARHQRFGLLKQQVVELRSRLPSDFQDVLEAGSRNQRNAAALALQQRVGADCSAAN